MHRIRYTSYNAYFLIPYFLWIAAGCALLLLLPDKQTLFALVNTHYNGAMDFVMFYLTWLGNGLVITILLTLLLFIKPLRSWWYASAALVCNLLPALCGQWLKHSMNTPRPVTYFHHAAWMHIGAGWPVLYSDSFPSGHTTGAFSLFCFLSMLLPERRRWIGILFFMMAALVAYSRLYLSAHFFEDVYAGSIIGGLLTLCLFYLMKKAERYFYKTTPI